MYFYFSSFFFLAFEHIFAFLACNNSFFSIFMQEGMSSAKALGMLVAELPVVSKFFSFFFFSFVVREECGGGLGLCCSGWCPDNQNMKLGFFLKFCYANYLRCKCF